MGTCVPLKPLENTLLKEMCATLINPIIALIL
jgi:hypothetical protein